MGVMIGIGVVIASIVGAALSQQVADEFKAWIPWLVELLIRRAVKQLPEECRKRLEEEWRAHIADIPGHLGKFFVALGLIVASRRIARISATRSMAGHLSSKFSRRIKIAIVVLKIGSWIEKRTRPLFPEEFLLNKLKDYVFRIFIDIAAETDSSKSSSKSN